MNASYLNNYRTAAADAIAVSYLARSDAAVLGDIGEFQQACNDGLLNSADDICALGSVTLGQSPGRVSATQITVFDSSGVAPQDLHVAAAVLAEAVKRGIALEVEF